MSRARSFSSLFSGCTPFDCGIDFHALACSLCGEEYTKNLVSRDDLMALAVRLSSMDNGGPFGAVIAHKVGDLFQIDSIGHNCVMMGQSSFFHAEAVAILSLFKSGQFIQDTTVLVTSCEPCSQCRSFFLAAGGNPDQIIYALSKKDAAQSGGFNDEENYRVFHHPISERQYLTWGPAIAGDNDIMCDCAGDDAGRVVADVLKTVVSVQKQRNSPEFGYRSTVFFNQLPSSLVSPINRDYLRLLFSFLDWAQLAIHITDDRYRTDLDSIILLSDYLCISGKQLPDFVNEARNNMRAWKQCANQHASVSYGQQIYNVSGEIENG